MEKKNICVYCSSSDALDEIYFKQARELGRLIAVKNYNLVYGGSNVGLMNEVACSVRNNGGHVIGVIPERIRDHGVADQLAHELLIAPDMKERKAWMRDRADAYVALPGGFGTLEEILEVITLKQLGVHQLPIAFVDVDGFYGPLLQQFEQFYEKGIAKPDYRSLYKVCDSSEKALDYISDYTPGGVTTKWF